MGAIGILICFIAVAIIGIVVAKRVNKEDEEEKSNVSTVVKRHYKGNACASFVFEPEERYHLTLKVDNDKITTHDAFGGVMTLTNGCEIAFRFDQDSFKSEIYLGAMENCNVIQSVKFTEEYLVYADGNYLLTWQQCDPDENVTA